MRADNPSTGVFFSLWKKYKPAILKLMIDAENGEQVYKFSKHEFSDIDPKRNTVYPFKLEIQGGNAVNLVKTSQVAADLLALLKQSMKAIELMGQFNYHFELDKEFNLKINQSVPEPVEEEVVEDEAPAEAEAPAEEASAEETPEE